MPMSETSPKPNAHANEANERLFEVLYDELKNIARNKMRGENAHHTLQPTALLNEAYLRVTGGGEEAVQWRDEKHFLCVASTAMRHILIDSARAKATAKRGGDHIQIDLDVSELSPKPVTEGAQADVISVHEALLKLQEVHPEQARLIELRFFGGLTIDEAADAMEISRSSAKNYWNFGKAWLYRELRD